jgi:hypothetical protein
MKALQTLVQLCISIIHITEFCMEGLTHQASRSCLDGANSAIWLPVSARDFLLHFSGFRSTLGTFKVPRGLTLSRITTISRGLLFST